MTHTTTSSGRRLLGTNTREASFSPLVKPKVPLYLDLNNLEPPSSLPRPLYTDLLKPKTLIQPPSKLSIPSCWNPKDKSQFLDISESNTRISYQGPGKSDMDAATVRANHPIPHQCGIFYYEIEIISKGRDGYIAIGFTGPHVSLGRLPGWDDMSWGYHGDDGNSFACSGTGKSYGPTFTTGDVIGCIINFSDNSASFTKNGLLLGTAFKDFPKDIKDKKQNVSLLYPAIGLRTPGEVIQVNFGQKPFIFDIEHYFKEEKIRFHKSITTSQRSGFDIHSLVLGHLIHSGYHESAKSFFQSLYSTKSEEFVNLSGCSSIQIRQELRELVNQGNIQQAFQLISIHYTSLFDQFPLLHFALSVQKFIEMIRSHLYDMDIESTSQDYLLQVIQYGQEMQNQFNILLTKDKTIQEALDQVFSLLCYENPENSIVSFLLDKWNWSCIAEALNSAILEFESSQLQDSPLEKIYRQSVTVYKELLDLNVGSAAFIHIERDLL